ncbi:ATP-dependent Clp protease ATP-binding subunit [Kribbella pittospori]|uniref:ATP-dependent Clp protease ATP-binding subunit n=1 Tax=Kribbella pittospori TaxID=722689 RepID=A0A4R0KX06_9ACTN|nr:Clp protease N-terminal domain-containing protein [Kribbella pittospori]TCC65633.1 ATP-dependent Clp protease ATP-binding subunit [Kribbella pittospori]
MTPGPDLQQLINTIKADAGSDDELEQLAAAASTISELTSTGDAALGFFVDRARVAGKSWVEISAVLGVSKQAAHKRFADSWTSKPAFNRYTKRAMAVVKAAAEVARFDNHDYIGTEHLLLAFYAEPESLGTKALLHHGITKEKVRAAVDEVNPAEELTDPPKTLDAERPPFTRRTAHVLQGAVGEALTLGHNYIGTEHLLLAFYRDSAGLATKILLAEDFDETAAWTALRALLEEATK